VASVPRSRDLHHGRDNAMRKDLPAYPAYKDSGVPYLANLPDHWDLRALKTCIRKATGSVKAGPFGTQLLSSEMYEEGPVKVLNQRNVIEGDIAGGENFISSSKFEQLRAFEVFLGDVLLTTRGTIGR